MTVTDLLADAIAELYSADPDEFVRRRGDLVSRAREAGQTAAAKRIAALRKPTRSAWVVNQLVRSQPGVIDGLSDLGEELRSAQRSLDGEAIRELSRRRRQLVEDLVRQALEISGQRSPPAALRDEVTATLSAAVADPQVAAKLGAGTLERAAHHEGFGPAGPPALSLVPPLAEDEHAEDEPATRRGRGRAPRPARPAAGRGARSQESRGAPAALGGTPSGGGRAAARSTTPGAGPAPAPEAAADTATPAERARAERERRLAEAERQAADADSAADAATTTEQDQEAAVRQLEEQLAQARVRLADVRQQARRARAGQRRARQALDRLRQ